jgi:hypothetical protein
MVSTAAAFLDIEKKTFDITWYLGLLYKLFGIKFFDQSNQALELFLSQRKLRVSAEGEISK